MKLVILSDTHGNQTLALSIIDDNGDADHFIHLGDEVDDACFLEDISGRPVIKISGNCDYTTAYPREKVIELDGHRVMLTHGDLYQVKAGIEKLRRRAGTEKVDVVLYGHTHQPTVQELDGILFVNPGCLKNGCDSLTYAVVTLTEQAVTAEIVSAAPSVR